MKLASTFNRTSSILRSREALTDEQIRHVAPSVFADTAHDSRFEPDSTVKADKLLTTRRHADNGPDMWRTLNRVQENVIRGGIGYVQTTEKSGTSFRRTREVKGIDQTVGINRALWVLAEEMAKIKNA